MCALMIHKEESEVGTYESRESQERVWGHELRRVERERKANNQNERECLKNHKEERVQG